MADKNSVTIEIKDPEFALGAILQVIADAEWNDGVGLWINEESDIDPEQLDENTRLVWDIREKIKQQL